MAELHEKETEYNKVCWYGLDKDQDKDHWWTSVVMTFRVPKKARNFLTSSACTALKKLSN
jgi:hypothetical protein